MHHSDDEGQEISEDDDDEEEEAEEDDGEEEEEEDGDENQEPPAKKTRKDSVGSTDSKKEFLTLEEKRRKAAAVAAGRILTDADFRKIDAAQLRKQVQAHRKGSFKAKAKTRKRKAEEQEAAEEADLNASARKELVDLSSIEMVYKKRKHDKASRLETVMEGRKDRPKFGSKKGKGEEGPSSTSHKVKAKNKNFMMVKHKLKRKAKRSFVEKARDLKRSLVRSRKFK